MNAIRNWFKKQWAAHKERQRWNAEQEYRADMGYKYQNRKKS